MLHEDTRTGGFGAEIAATIAEEAFEHLDAPVKRIAAPDSPVPFSPPLEQAFIPQVDRRRRRAPRARGLLERISYVATGTQIEVVMPQMGVSVSEGTITKWLKQPGDAIAQDEALLEISTDKVDTEVPSPGDGVVSEILVGEGQTVEVGTVLAIIAPAGAAVADGSRTGSRARGADARSRSPEPLRPTEPAATPEPAHPPTRPSPRRPQLLTRRGA